MAQSPPEGYQQVIPYLTYDDAPAAVDFICKAFGFTERMRMPGPEGLLMHAELVFSDSVLMLSSVMPDMGIASPKNLPAVHGNVTVYMADVDAHYAQAKAAGAAILEEPTDMFWGDRLYRAADPEGHNWTFMQHVRDVSEEEMAAALAQMGGQ